MWNISLFIVIFLSCEEIYVLLFQGARTDKRDFLVSQLRSAPTHSMTLGVLSSLSHAEHCAL